MKRRVRFCIAGSGRLTLQCADIISQAGHDNDIVLVVSHARDLRNWASEKHIPFLRSFQDGYRDGIVVPAFDYLFSIINGEIWDKTILDLPAKFAINYHNSLLPAYAGMHAASWALLNGEKEHGVTWHLMSERIDAGDILKQEHFDIGPRDTAEDVNRACHRLAGTTLRQLLEDLREGGPIARPQNLRRRSYFSSARSGRRGGLVSWLHTADQIDRLVRAHHIGPIMNTFGLPKIRIRDDFYIPTATEILPVLSRATPGILIAKTDDGLRVATASSDILIRGLMKPNGTPVETLHLARELGLHVNAPLPFVSPLQQSKLDALLNKIRDHEGFCADAYRAASNAPPALPEKTYEQGVPVDALWLIEATPHPVLLDRAVERFGPKYMFSDLLVTALLRVFFPETSESPVSLSYGFEPTRDLGGGLAVFFNTSLPLTIANPAGLPPREALERVARQAHAIERHGLHCRDLLLRRKLADRQIAMPRVAVYRASRPISSRPSRPRLTITIHPLERRMWLSSAPDAKDGSLTPVQMARIAADACHQIAAMCEGEARDWIGQTSDSSEGASLMDWKVVER